MSLPVLWMLGEMWQGNCKGSRISLHLPIVLMILLITKRRISTSLQRLDIRRNGTNIRRNAKACLEHSEKTFRSTWSTAEDNNRERMFTNQEVVEQLENELGALGVFNA